jgi:glycosyltransferase involved in cell wall biosynthesis
VSAPQVSVILPTRDRAGCLALALRSALGQREVEVEVVVIDEGSRDGTRALLAGIEDPRLRTIRHEEPVGVSAARNRGIAEASGPWVAFLDDDDLWAPDKLRRQLDAAAATGRRWVYGGEVTVDEWLRVVDGAPPPPPEKVVADLDRFDAVPGGTSSVMVAADLLEEVGGFDPDLATSEDWDLWIRLSRAGPPACVPGPVVALSGRRGRSGSMPRMLEEIEVVSRRYGIRADRERHLRWAGWEALRDRRRMRAARAYLAAALRGDRRSVLRAGAALVAPGTAERRARAAGGRSPWAARADAWIRPLAGGGGLEG